MHVKCVYILHVNASSCLYMYIYITKAADRRESSPLGTMGTLDDIDKDYSKIAPPPSEEEVLDLHGNEETAPPVISDCLLTLFPPYQVLTHRPCRVYFRKLDKGG